jgi:hypothetical protein
VSLLIGVAGVVLILVAFILDEFFENFNQDTLQYNFMNIVGAGLLAYYAYVLESWPFAVLNVVWAGVAIIKLIRIGQKRKKF